MHGRIRLCAPVLLLVLSTGCFSYRPAPVAEVAPGRTVRAFLTTEQAREINAVLGRSGRELVGKVVESRDEGLLLEVRAVTVNEGLSGRTLNQRVAIPLSGIMEVEERTLNGWKTALVTLGIAAAVGGLLATQLDEGENSPTGNRPDPPESLRRPAIRIQIPIPGGP